MPYSNNTGFVVVQSAEKKDGWSFVVTFVDANGQEATRVGDERFDPNPVGMSFPAYPCKLFAIGSRYAIVKFRIGGKDESMAVHIDNYIARVP